MAIAAMQATAGTTAEVSAGPLRILISDKIAPECLAVLDGAREEPGARPVTYDYRPGLEREKLLQDISLYDGLIIRSATKVDGEVLARAARLTAVVRAGVGVDNIDLEQATRRGVLVMNCPRGNTVAAAEHTIALLCSLARNIPQAHQAMKEGRWERGEFVGTELGGKVLGVLGLGKVGREVCRRARGLGMRVVGYDPFVSEDAARALEIEVASCDAVMKLADFLSVHVPLTDETRGLVGAEAFGAMKQGVRILNVARGGVIDEAALLEALESGKVAGAALDVYSQEPPAAGDPLVGHARVVVTPHLGASTREAQEAVGTESARQLLAYLRRGRMENAVNTVALDPALLERMAPWREIATRLGSFQAQLREGAVRRITLRYAGEVFGDGERKLLGLAFLQGFLSHYLDTPVNRVNAALFAREHGVRVTEEQTTDSEGYVNLLTAEVETSVGTEIRIRRLAGTVFGERRLRLVQLDGYQTDAVLEGELLIVSNDDRPGIIGRIGSTLAEEEVNIASMSMGRDGTGGTAVAILTLDSAVPLAAREALSASPGIIWVKTVGLQQGF